MSARPPRPAASLAWMMTTLALTVLLWPRASQAQDEGPAERGARAQVLSPAAILAEAGDALTAGEYQRAADLARGVLANPDVEPLDRSEAWRLTGLAWFFLERFNDAEEAFLEYLILDVDGRLDPALVPPEAIVFFEDVRARNAAELRKYRPKAEPRRYRALNLLPPLGQLQNGHRTKAWVLTGLGAFSLATNLTTYVILQRWCDGGTEVCQSGGESRDGQARTLRSINWVAGLTFIGVLAYGMYDGFSHYRPNRVPTARRVNLRIFPTTGGAAVGLEGRF